MLPARQARAAGRIVHSMNDGIEEPKRRENFSAEELADGWVSWNLKDPSRFNAFIEPLSVRVERPTEDGRPRARVRMSPERKHSNLGDNVHGAVTLALVDIALFAASHQFGALDAGHSVTLDLRSEEQTSELQTIMRNSDAVF